MRKYTITATLSVADYNGPTAKDTSIWGINRKPSELFLESDQWVSFCRFASNVKSEYVNGVFKRVYHLHESMLFFMDIQDRYFWADVPNCTITEIPNDPQHWTEEQHQQYDDYLTEQARIEYESEIRAEIQSIEWEEEERSFAYLYR